MAKPCEMTLADRGIQRVMIPRCKSFRFYQHQVWGIQFVVQRLVNHDGLNSCLVADNLGIGKVSNNSVSVRGGMLTSYVGRLISL